MSVKVTRIDRGELGQPIKLPNGMLRLDGHFTRTGVFTYRNADGSLRREYRPPSEVFDAASLESLKMVPVTDEHPPALLTAQNATEYGRGSIGETVRRDGDKIAGHLVVTDSTLVGKLERDEARQTSCGYTADMDELPGISPSGERYDAVQKNIRYNHVAIVKRGRAGDGVRVRMDAESLAVVLDQHPEAPGAHHMHTVRVDGIDYPSDSPALVQALALSEKRRADALAAAEKRADDAAKALETVQAKLDTADGEVKKLKADAAELPKKIRGEIAARMTLEARARGALGEKAKLDGLDDKAVRLAVLAKLVPDVKLDGKTDAYVEARFDSELERFDGGDKEADTDNDEDDKVGKKKGKKMDGAEEHEDADLDEHGRVRLDADAERSKMLAFNRKLASRPVGASIDESHTLRMTR